MTEGEKILTLCDNEYWRAPHGKVGEEAEIIIDMKCPVLLESFSILNGFGDFGIKDFSLFGSRKLNGPWTRLFSGKLPQGLKMMDEVIFHSYNIDCHLYFRKLIAVCV